MKHYCNYSELFHSLQRRCDHYKFTQIPKTQDDVDLEVYRYIQQNKTSLFVGFIQEDKLYHSGIKIVKDRAVACNSTFANSYFHCWLESQRELQDMLYNNPEEIYFIIFQFKKGRDKINIRYCKATSELKMSSNFGNILNKFYCR